MIDVISTINNITAIGFNIGLTSGLILFFINWGASTVFDLIDKNI